MIVVDICSVTYLETFETYNLYDENEDGGEYDVDDGDGGDLLGDGGNLKLNQRLEIRKCDQPTDQQTDMGRC